MIVPSAFATDMLRKVWRASGRVDGAGSQSEVQARSAKMLIASRQSRLVGDKPENAGCTTGQPCPLRRVGRDLIRSQAMLAEQGHGRLGKLHRHRAKRQAIADHEFMVKAEQHKQTVRCDDSSLPAVETHDRFE